jgi:SAM-dependent methyltransferase
MITVDFKYLPMKKGARILDIGSGPGRHTAAVYSRENVMSVGADLNFDDLLLAKDRLEYHDKLGFSGGGTWNLVTSDITKLPFADESFDIVICSEVMEHIPDDDRAASEILRVLKKNGTLAVSVPRMWPEKICWMLSDDYFNANQGHVRIYRKSTIKNIFKNKNCRFLRYHFAHSLHSPYWWLKCLVGPRREDSRAVNIYKKFLEWDIIKKPFLTRFLDRVLNPVCGKSIVLYFQKK